MVVAFAECPALTAGLLAEHSGICSVNAVQ